MSEPSVTFLDTLNDAFDITAANRAERLGTVPDADELQLIAARFALGVASDVMSNFLSTVSGMSPTGEIHPDLAATVNRIDEAWAPILAMDLPADKDFKNIVGRLLKRLATPVRGELSLKMEEDTSKVWSETDSNFKQIYEFFKNRVTI